MKINNAYGCFRNLSWLFFLAMGLFSCRETPAGHNSVAPPVNMEARKQSIDLAMVTFPGYAPLYLAKEKGFFGPLQVNLERIEDIATIRAAMASGRLEGYLATMDIALDTNSKPEGVAVWAVDESAGGDGVVVTGDIRDLTDLQGKRIAAEPGFPPYFILLYLLKDAGLDASQVKLQDMATADAAAAFASGALDAAAVYEPFLSQAVKARQGRILLSSADVPGLIVDSIFVRRNVLNEEGTILQLIKGWQKALAYIQSNPEESYKIMARSFKMSVEEFKDIAGAVKWLDLEQNQKLFGSANQPGLLHENFTKVHAVLKANRPKVFNAVAKEHLDARFVNLLSVGF